MISGGIFGPKLCGKTTLAVEMSHEYWNQKAIRTLVFDPHLETWGPQAWVCDNEDVFWPTIWKTRNCLIIVEEASSTIRRDRDLMPVFNRLRHCCHRLLVVGHDGTDLLPAMRRQLDTLYLFKQSEDAVKEWYKVFPDREIIDKCPTLARFHFLEIHSFQTPIEKTLTL